MDDVIDLDDLDDDGWLSPVAPLGSPDPLRVYIACSLTSDNSRELRDDLLTEAERLFTAFGFQVYNPARYTRPGSPHTPAEVAAIDNVSAVLADLVFFIRLQPSIGMGIEAQIAADTLIPWADARTSDESFRQTPLLSGLPNPGAGPRITFRAEHVAEFSTRLREVLSREQWQKRALAMRQQKEIARAAIRRLRLGHTLRRQRLLLGLKSAQLAKRVDLEAWWIESIERSEDLIPCLSFAQLLRLVTECRLRFVAGDPDSFGFPDLVPVDSFEPKLFEAASEFADYSLRSRHPAEPPAESDDEMLRGWNARCAALGLQIRPIPAERGQSSKRPKRLTARMAMPLSGLTEEQNEEVRRVMESLRGVLEGQLPVQIDPSMPTFHRTNRDEIGSDIYSETVTSLGKCDFAVALVTPAATGVGITTRLFANSTMPTLLLARIGEPVSRMAEGMYCKRVGDILRFDSPEAIDELVRKRIRSYLPMLQASAARRRAILQMIIESPVAEAIDRYRIPRRMSREEALNVFTRVMFIRGEWLAKLVEEPAILASVTLLQFVHIANDLHWRISVSSSGVPCFEPDCVGPDGVLAESISPAQQRAVDASLSNLLSARKVLRRESLFGSEGDAGLDDERLFRHWETYWNELTLDAGRYEDVRLERTVDEWITVLRSEGAL